MPNISLILNELRRHKGFSTKAKFADFLGISAQNLGNWYKRKTYDCNLLIVKFTDVNPEWIMTGKGEMLKSNSRLNEDSDLKNAKFTAQDVDNTCMHTIAQLVQFGELYTKNAFDSILELKDHLKKEVEYLRQENERLKAENDALKLPRK